MFQIQVYNLARFLACWPDTLAQEDPDPNNWSNPANGSDTPCEPGGLTMNGITKSECSLWLASQGLPNKSVLDITYAQGEAIYLSSYWLPNCPSLPPGLDLCVFDSSVNMGPGEGTMILQYLLGISVDGIWGPQTAAAIRALTVDPGNLTISQVITSVINGYTARREAVYRSFGEFGEFGGDWIRRAQTIGSQAAAMAGAATVKLSPPKRVPKCPSWFAWHHKKLKAHMNLQSEISIADNSILNDLDTWVRQIVPDPFQGQALSAMPAVATSAATNAVGAIEAWRATQPPGA